METNSLYDTNLETTPYGKILQAIIRKDGFSGNIIENYNNEVNKIRDIIRNTKISVSNGEVSFENIQYEKPGGNKEPMTPSMARAKLTPYFADIHADLVFTPKPVGRNLDGSFIYPNEAVEPPKNVYLGSIPVMLGSELCWLNKEGASILEEKEERMKLGECFNDPLGYFFIKSERVILIRENLRNSVFLIYTESKSSVVGKITCPTVQGTTVVEIKISKHQCLKITLQHYLKKKEVGKDGLPIFMIFQILGISPEEALEMIYSFTKKKNHRRIYYAAQPSLADFRAKIPTNSVESCLAYIYRFREKMQSTTMTKDKIAKPLQEENIIPDIQSDLFPNIDKLEDKIQHLAMYCAKMFEYMIGERNLDDRDSWSNNQLISAGPSITKLFKNIWTNMMKDLVPTAGTQKGIKAVKDNYNTSEIRDNFVKAFGPNGWTLKDKRNGEDITDAVKRDTPLAIYSEIARVTVRSNKQTKSIDIRVIQPSQLGYICLYETPEGSATGLTKNLACTCYISLERDVNVILGTIKEGGYLSMFVSENKMDDDQSPLLVNGVIRGWCNPDIIVPMLRNMRRNGVLHKDVCIFHNERDNMIEIYCDGGRPTRPLFIVGENGQLEIINKGLMYEEDVNVDDLIGQGCIEYIDAREQEFILLAQSIEELQASLKMRNEGMKTPNYTHCEIDPAAMFSIPTGIVPQCNRQAGPRTSYQAGMNKQALGQYNSNEHYRFDTSAKMIHYPTKALFQTDVEDTVGLNYMPTGQTLQIAIYAHADNPEDGIVFKEEAIKYANVFDMCKTITVTSVAKSGSGKENFTETFARPTIRPGEGESRYDAIDDFGLPKLDSYIRQGDCIIGKVRTYIKDRRVENISEFAGIGKEGYVDRVLITMDPKNQMMVRVKIRKNRKFISGDKICCRYSQKGTISKIVSVRNLPRVKDGPNKGMAPDVLINPHSIFSRMTMNMIFEIKTSKAALVAGKYVNATTFRNFDEEMKFAEETLAEYGLDIHGKENFVLPNGRDIRSKIYFGPCYYQALRHQVSDKIQMRAMGGIKMNTRQPVQGRANEGGLKVGEMERDALISHGSSAILRERMCDVSDAFNLPICGQCGTIAIINHSKKQSTCKLCGPKATFGIITIPYAVKLLLHYLNAAGIHMTFKTENMFTNVKRFEERFLI
jgi:DNA-directed RNA polymerase II subunit RPB2